MLVGRYVLATFGWTAAALVTPTMLMSTGAIFFSLSLFPSLFAPVTKRRVVQLLPACCVL